jgi:two-component system, cell cycle sensor histidine kinase and response regulator CckA
VKRAEHTWPVDFAPSAPWVLGYGAVVLATLAALGAYLAWSYLPSERAEAQATWRARLENIAQDRSEGLDVWLRDGLRDAQEVAAEGGLTEALAAPASKPAGLLEHALHSTELDQRGDLAGMLLLDVRLAPRWSSGGLAPSPALVAMAKRVLVAGGPGVEVVRVADGRVVVAFASTVVDPATGRPAGVAVLVADPRHWVYPMLRREEFPTETGEVTLARADGEEITNLSPLRLIGGAPLLHRRRLDRAASPQAQALAGNAGFGSYVDYRGVRVLAATRRLSAAPWGLVAKVDESEALRPAMAHVREIGAVLGLAVLTLAAAGFAAWRGARALHYKGVAASHAEVAELFEHGPDAGVVVAGGRIVAANRAAGEMFGCPADSLISLRPWRLGPTVQADGSSSESALRSWVLKLEPGARRRFDLRCRRFDGTEFDAEISATVVAGTPPRVIGWLRDVTEERAVRERLTLLVEGSQRFFFYVQELDGSLSYISPSVEAVTGYPPQRWLSERSWFVTDNPVNQEARARTRRHLQGELSDGAIAVEIRHAAGHPVMLEIHEFGRYSGRRLVGVHGIAHDVSDRHRAERALRQSEARLRELLENLGEGVTLVDPSEHVLYANPAADAIFGVPTGALTGRNVSDFMVEESRARVLAETSRRREGVKNTYEVEIVRPSGARRTLLVTATPQFAGAGDFSGALAIFRDITEQRQVEQQLLQAQRLEAIGQLAGGIAHDFNNLLQAMLALTQVIAARAGEPERVRAGATELSEHVRRGAGMTRQLLLFSHREATRFETVDLGAVVRHSTDLLRRLLRESVSLRLDLAAQPLPVRADRGQLEQVLINLALNAADAMPDGGVLRVGCRRLDPGHAELEVADTGHGIPAEVRARIFEPFFTTKSPDKGTGLGLSVVHGIVVAHGGEIAVDSEPGRGTAFRITLPLAAAGEPAAPATAPAIAEEPAGGGGERILVVEDEAAAREALRDALAMLGYSVTAVASGEAAGLLPAEPRFDVLLTDFQLPGVSGTDLAIGLRDRWPDLAVVLMSGYAEDDTVREAIKLGAIRFLQKPFTIEAVAREMREALATRTAG